MVRIATHVPCLEFLKAQIRPLYGIEHGMGVSSTQWFHSMDVLVSYENVEKWQKCKLCESPTKCQHFIYPYNSDTLKKELSERIPDLSKTIALVDGPGNQRVGALMLLMVLGIPGIVFHDAETLTQEEVLQVKVAASENNYRLWQCVSEDPENLVCSRKDLPVPEHFLEF